MIHAHLNQILYNIYKIKTFCIMCVCVYAYWINLHSFSCNVTYIILYTYYTL